MIESLPIALSLSFLITVGLTFYLLMRALSSGSSSLPIAVPIILIIWMGVQSIITYFGFYSESTMSMPPRFFLAFFPMLIALLILFIRPKSRAFIQDLSLKELTWIHIVRIPVEFCLYYLFLYQAIPELMTFAGRNFDILAGITAPLIIWMMVKNKISKPFLIVWNVLSLLLLVFIIFNGILSAPTAIQKFAFDQPNIALFHFPFVLLPAFVVPAVLFSHFASLSKLLAKK